MVNDNSGTVRTVNELLARAARQESVNVALEYHTASMLQLIADALIAVLAELQAQRSGRPRGRKNRRVRREYESMTAR
jgi:hypothetical protein